MRFIGSSRQLKLTAVVILADDADNFTGVPLGGLFQLESNRQIYATRKGPKQNSQTKRTFLKSGLIRYFHSWPSMLAIGCGLLLLCYAARGRHQTVKGMEAQRWLSDMSIMEVNY